MLRETCRTLIYGGVPRGAKNLPAESMKRQNRIELGKIYRDTGGAHIANGVLVFQEQSGFHVAVSHREVSSAGCCARVEDLIPPYASGAILLGPQVSY